MAMDAAASSGALDAVRQLERALEERDDAHSAADAALDAARAEAERLVAEARAVGTDAGRRLRATLLAEAEADAEAARTGGEAAAQRLRERAARGRGELIADLAALLLAPEG
jgi:hypothetical protein